MKLGRLLISGLSRKKKNTIRPLSVPRKKSPRSRFRFVVSGNTKKPKTDKKVINILPETVVHLKRELELKANWEFEDVDIDLGN